MLVKDETVGGPDMKRIAKIIQKIEELEYHIQSMQELLVTSTVFFFSFPR